MSLTSLVLKFAAPIPDIEKYERFLFIGPHPDDIEIGAGATAAKLAAAAKNIRFVICTDGRYGDGFVGKDISAEELISLRRHEAVNSAKALGVDDVRFLELSDGGIYEKEQLVKALAAEIGDFKPDVVFAPDPSVKSECHADHLNVGEAARQASYFAPYKGIMERYGADTAPVKALAFYMTAKPNRFIKTGKYLEKQINAIFKCHKSQFPDDSTEAKSIELYLRLRSIDMGLRRFSLKAEGFRVLGQTHMHCLPEADK